MNKQNNQQQTKFEQLPFGQRIQVVHNLMPYPALTVMVLLRGDLGYRMVNPVWLGGITVFEIVLAVCLNPVNSRFNPLFIFALISFAFGMYQRFKRWREIERGARQHSFFMGTSRFHFSWLPMFCQKNRRVERFVDPILVFIIGSFLLPFMPLFGFYLAMAGAFLRVFESDIYEKEKNQNLDITDGIIVSEIQGQVVEKFEESPVANQQQPASGLSSGLGDDLRDQIKRLKETKTKATKGK